MEKNNHETYSANHGNAFVWEMELTKFMSNRRFHVYIEQDKDSGLFAARCLEMSVFSQGKTEQEALRNIRAAIGLHLDTLEDEVKGKKLVEVEV